MSTEDAIARAERYLKTADMLIEDGDYESSVSRSYYAMFFVARALLRQVGSDPQTHSGIRNQFGLHFVKEGPLAERFAGMLNDTEEMRTLADYAEEFVLTKRDAQATRKDAEAFVDRVSTLLNDES
jgi:uncharacterized protein (UPF0332 family)